MTECDVSIERIDPVLAVGVSKPYALYRIDGLGRRYYFRVTEAGDDVIFYPSVTSVLGATMPTPPYLTKWIATHGLQGAYQMRDEAATYGTMLHVELAKFLVDGSYVLTVPYAQLVVETALTESYAASHVRSGVDRARVMKEWPTRLVKDMTAMAQVMFDRKVTVIAVEMALCSDKLRTAGAMDLVCEMDFDRKRVRALWDLKSSQAGQFSFSHEAQLHIYRALWNETFPDMPVSHVFNLSPSDWRDKPTYTLKNQTDSKAMDVARLLLDVFHMTVDEEPADHTVFGGLAQMGEAPPLPRRIPIKQYALNLIAQREAARALDVNTAR